MAKKSASRRKGASPQRRFDDAQYDDVRFTATFEYNELSLARAASWIWPRGKYVTLGVAFVSLLLLVGMLYIDQGLLIPAMAPLAVSIVASSLNSRWDKVQLRYARRSSLALDETSDPQVRHVVVCGDAVHVEVENGPKDTYPLSDLRVIHSNHESVFAGFGDRRYVYVPRSAMSEGRFHELVRFLERHLS